MLRNLKISYRAVLFFALLGLITLLLGVFSITQLKQLNDSNDELGLERMPRITTAGNLRVDFLMTRLRAASLGIAETEADRQRLIGDINKFTQGYTEKAQQLEKISRSAEAQSILKELQQSKNEYDQNLKQYMKFLADEDFTRANELQQEKLNANGVNTLTLINKFVAYQNEGAQVTVADSERAYQTAVKSVIVSLVVVIAIIAVLAIVLSRSIVLPMRQTVESSQRIASGDLTQILKVEGKDEAADMMHALNRMQTQLRETISHITDSSQQLAATSEELSTVTNDSSEIVHQQAEQLEQAATAVNEMTAAIDEVANNANLTSQNAETLHSTSQEGQSKLINMVDTLKKLVAELNNTSSGISELAADVDKIGQVIVVIQSVAEQTNLLALNAAIEAARAGESGRGFAVVADEVRGLAHRTHEATQQIEQMIHAVQERTKKAVGDMNISNQWADNTLSMSGDVVAALTQAANLIEQINSQNMSVASAAEEQAAVAREVDKNLVAIRDLSFQTSAGANQTNASSQELAGLAERLNGLVTQFRI